MPFLKLPLLLSSGRQAIPCVIASFHRSWDGERAGGGHPCPSPHQRRALAQPPRRGSARTAYTTETRHRTMAPCWRSGPPGPGCAPPASRRHAPHMPCRLLPAGMPACLDSEAAAWCFIGLAAAGAPERASGHRPSPCQSAVWGMEGPRGRSRQPPPAHLRVPARFMCQCGPGRAHNPSRWPCPTAHLHARTHVHARTHLNPTLPAARGRPHLRI